MSQIQFPNFDKNINLTLHFGSQNICNKTKTGALNVSKIFRFDVETHIIRIFLGGSAARGACVRFCYGGQGVQREIRGI